MNLLGKNNKNSNLNYIFFGCIIILLILYVFNLEKDNNLKVTTIKHKDIIENFITPTKLNTPLYFELYKIDKTNKNLSCIFNEPYNNIIANQVKKYMLVINSYILNTEIDTSKILETDNKDIPIYKLLDQKLIIKDKKELNNIEVNNKLKLKFDIALPKEYYIENDNSQINTNDNTDDNKLNPSFVKQAIFYRLGLVAIYDNIYSAIVPTINQNLFTLESEIDYNENKLFSELKKEYGGTTPLSLLDDTNNDNNTEQNKNLKYEQIKEQLGGYPLNLILDEQTGVKSLSELMEMVTNNSVNIVLNDKTQ